MSREIILKPMGFQKLTVSSTAVGLTVPTGTKYAMMQLDNSNTLRWRDDGTDPDASTGMLLEAGDALWYTGLLNKFKAIRVASDATLTISYYS